MRYLTCRVSRVSGQHNNNGYRARIRGTTRRKGVIRETPTAVAISGRSWSSVGDGDDGVNYVYAQHITPENIH